MTDWPILSTVTFLPLVGVLLILFIKDDSESARHNIRNVAFLRRYLFYYFFNYLDRFDSSNPNFQMVEKFSWLGNGISYHMGVDGISILLLFFQLFFCLFVF
ncbi:hypothetical protein MNL09_03275 [Bartonella krasnovii]|nr:hypothetical protein MNL09_03275 [Bartonella krasnovii]